MKNRIALLACCLATIYGYGALPPTMSSSSNTQPSTGKPATPPTPQRPQSPEKKVKQETQPKNVSDIVQKYKNAGYCE